MHNRLELQLRELNPNLFGKLQETKTEVKLLLQKYASNFPEYTDHSIDHTQQVFDYASDLLSDEQIENLNDDEIYVLSMACYLHDVGMCIPEEKIKEIEGTEEIQEYRKNNPDKPVQDYIRDIHHELSYKFIVKEQELLKIPNEKYAKAIGLVAQGHRKVDLGNIDEYKPRFTVKGGKTFVCLPYLSAIIRLADELDITNIRTPKLLQRYYMPENERSIYEWKKHIATTMVNLLEDDDYIRFEVTCTDQNVYAALKEQFEKVRETILYAQKIVRGINRTGKRIFELSYNKIDVQYDFKGFDPKGIKFSFNVNNVVKTFIGENLYENKLDALREVIQNAIDTCRYKKVLLKEKYVPEIEITIKDDQIMISDNGLGMDEYIIENYFGKLASSYYQQESIKKDFEAIGQFGIGVFSYFLIAEFIDIETKTDKDKALRFRIDKDPNSYFHFFDKATRKQSGTTITLNLKKDFEFEVNEICEYIENTFKYVEIPIKLRSNIEEKRLTKQSFNFDEKELLQKSVDYQYKDDLDSFDYFTYNFNEEEYEGSLTYFYHKSHNNIGYYIDTEIFRIEFLVFQKGVYVNSNRAFFNPIRNTKGVINLKANSKISLSRNEFSSNGNLSKIMLEITGKFIKTLFKRRILLMEKANLPEFTFNFFRKFYSGKIISDLMYFNVFKNGVNEIVTLKELKEQAGRPIIITDHEKPSVEEKKSIVILTKIVDNSHFEVADSFFRRSFSDKHFEYDVIDSIWKLTIGGEIKNGDNYESSIEETFIQLTFLNLKNSNCLIFSFNKNGFADCINRNHVFVKAINQLDDNIIKGNRKVLKEMFRLIQDSYFEINRSYKKGNKKILLLNELTKELSRKIDIDYTFTKKDFQLE